MADQGLKDIEADQLESDYDKAIISRFDEMNLNPELLHSVYVYGLEVPSSVQQRAIPSIIKGNDVILEAPAGTGKTLALCISALQIIDPNIRACQALIVTPTADMARNVHKTIVEIGQFAQIECLLIDRKYNINDETSKLYDSHQFVVATPGRLLDLVQRRAITIDSTVLFVIHEADEICARGFTEHIIDIHQLVPGTAQVILSSVTIPREVLETANKLMRDPSHIAVKRTKSYFSNIKHFYVTVDDEDLKLDFLRDLSGNLGVAQAVIFCNTRKKVEWLANQLTTRGITISAMHGDMPAFERADIVKQCRSGSPHILLATNLLARGLDVQQSSLVVNYELPALIEEYIHRTHRTHRTNYGTRSEQQYTTFNLINSAEISKIRDIDDHYNIQVEELSITEARNVLDFTRNIA